jgi:hypothetical protein
MLDAEQRQDWEAWDDLNADLGRELRLKLWRWPPIERPGSKCTYPPGTAGDAWFPDAVKLDEILSAAARAMKLADR